MQHSTSENQPIESNEQWRSGFRHIVHWRFWLKVAKRFAKRGGPDSVGVLAYTSLVGIVPMLAVMLALFSVSNYFEDFENLVMNQVVKNLIPTSQPVIEEYLMAFSLQAAQLKLPGLVVMLLTTLMLLWKVDSKINELWQYCKPRPWWRNILHYLGVSLVGPILLGASIVLSSMILALPVIVDVSPLVEGMLQGAKLLPLLLSLLGFTLLYKMVPAAVVPVRYALIGGFFATLQLELLKSGFALYVKLFPTYDVIYGAFAAVPLFLLWLYLLWFVLIWNASVVAELSESGRKPKCDLNE